MQDVEQNTWPGRLPWLLVCFYAPYSWLLLINHPWDGYRWHWIGIWPMLPGLFIQLVPMIHNVPDWVGRVLMGVFTLGMIALAASFASRGIRSAIVVFALVTLLSSMNSWIAYTLFWF